MSRSHDARRFRLTLASLSHLYPVSDARLDALAENPQWADHHDVHDLVGELTARRLRRGPPAPIEAPRTPEDVRRDPRVGDTVYRAGSQGAQPFARVAAVLDGYVVVEVPDGRPLVWTVAHWGFQGVAGDRYEHVAVEEVPAPPERARAHGALGTWGDPEAYETFAAYKATRKHLRRRRADKAAAHERVLNFGQHRNDAQYVQDALDHSEGVVYAGRPRYNRNYRHLPTPATPDDAPTSPYEAAPAPAPETLAAVWPSR